MSRCMDITELPVVQWISLQGFHMSTWHIFWMVKNSMHQLTKWSVVCYMSLWNLSWQTEKRSEGRNFTFSFKNSQIVDLFDIVKQFIYLIIITKTFLKVIYIMPICRYFLLVSKYSVIISVDSMIFFLLIWVWGVCLLSYFSNDVCIHTFIVM